VLVLWVLWSVCLGVWGEGVGCLVGSWWGFLLIVLAGVWGSMALGGLRRGCGVLCEWLRGRLPPPVRLGCRDVVRGWGGWCVCLCVGLLGVGCGFQRF